MCDFSNRDCKNVQHFLLSDCDNLRDILSKEGID